MASKRSEKMSQYSIDFTKRLKVNRIKKGSDEEPLAYWKLWDLVVNYFKENNDRYLELVAMEYRK